MLQDRVAALREANICERQAYRHLVGLPAILGEADGVVNAETPSLVVRIMRDGIMDLFATSWYVDALVHEGGSSRTAALSSGGEGTETSPFTPAQTPR